MNSLFLLNIVRVLITKLKETHCAESTTYMKAVRATLILIPLLGVQFILLPTQPEGRISRAIYDFFVNIVVHFQVKSLISEESQKHSSEVIVATVYCGLFDDAHKPSHCQRCLYCPRNNSGCVVCSHSDIRHFSKVDCCYELTGFRCSSTDLVFVFISLFHHFTGASGGNHFLLLQR